MSARTASSSPSASAGQPAPARPGTGRSPPPRRALVAVADWWWWCCALCAGRSLAEKVASVLGCVVIVSMEDYRTVAGADDGSDVDAIDFDALARNLQVRARTFLRFWGFFLEGWGLDTCRVLALMAGH